MSAEVAVGKLNEDVASRYAINIHYSVSLPTATFQCCNGKTSNFRSFAWDFTNRHVLWVDEIFLARLVSRSPPEFELEFRLSGNATYAAITSIVCANIVLVAYIIFSILDDKRTTPPAAPDKKTQ
jgi:hypothetical protein